MANDIIDINVYETTDSVAITVNPNLTTVNITTVNAGNGNVPVGGTVGQVLAKIDSANFNTQWVNQSGGGGGGATNLSTSQTSTNFTINSDTGTDAIVPLGNGTLSGATLNNYSNSEKALVATIPDINTNAINKDTVKLSEAINKGQAVYVSGASGTNILVSKASNISEALSSKTFGLLETTGALNAVVNVVSSGLLSGLNTNTATIGDAVWLGTSGNLIFGLTNKPVAPAHLVYIGVVTRVSATVGEIFVSIQNGFELQEIHNVLLTSLANNDILAYDSATSLWKNKTISSALGTVDPNNTNNIMTLTGAQTINGTKTFESAIVPIGGIIADGGGSANELFATDGTLLDITVALSGKQENLDGANFGEILNTFGSKTTVTDNDKISISDVASAPYGKTTSFSNVWINYLKPKADALYATITNLALKQDRSLSAYTVIANNTASTANGSNQVFKNFNTTTYSETIVTEATTAPSVNPLHSYTWNQVGNLVTFRISLSWTTAGVAVTGFICPLPSGLPTPEINNSATAATNIVSYGVGTLAGTKSSVATMGTCALRIKTLASPNTFELHIQRASGNYANAYATIQYFTV